MNAPAARTPATPNEPESGGERDVRHVVEGLKAELAQGRRRRLVRWFSTLVGGAALLGALIAYKRATAPPPEPRFDKAALEVRDIVEEVQSTGVVEPVNQVEVGAQVSGRVVTVDVDFNDQVKTGDQLASIDPELFGAEVVQQNAQLSAAQAAVKSAETRRDAIDVRLRRLRTLVGERVASEAELEQVQGEYDVAVAEVAATRAQIAQIQARLSSAKTTLTYTKIFSPIDGVVIDRKVEPGQTVASSFNTPVLFVIARDLQQMRVVAEIDEADVGKVKEGMKARVTVDAFPEDTFEGDLTQIRLSPNNVEGVVTYSAIIIVKNQDGKLRPGMTATATVVTRKVEKVLAARNAALRFEPLPEGQQAPTSTSDDEAPPETEQMGPKPGPGEGTVYLETGGPVEAPKTERRIVKVGISDGVWTEIRGGLDKQARVIVDEKPSQQQRGFRLF